MFQFQIFQLVDINISNKYSTYFVIYEFYLFSKLKYSLQRAFHVSAYYNNKEFIEEAKDNVQSLVHLYIVRGLDKKKPHPIKKYSTTHMFPPPF